MVVVPNEKGHWIEYALLRLLGQKNKERQLKTYKRAHMHTHTHTHTHTAI